LSIFSEIQAVFAGAAGTPLRDKQAPIHSKPDGKKFVSLL